MPDPSRSGPRPMSSPLAIRSIRRHLVRIPTTKEIVWGSGVRNGVTRMIVEVETEGGVTGWGETICLLDAIPAVLDRVVMPHAIGRTVDQAEKLHRHILGAGYYHHKRAAVMAICAVEMAMWDAFGKVCGQPLHRLWGGLWRDPIPLAAYLLQSDPVAVVEDAKEYLRQGYTTFKLKIGYDEASDIDLTRRVRETIGEGVPLRLDVNGAWTPGTAKRQCRRARALRPVLHRAAARTRRPRGPSAAARADLGADRARRERLHARRHRQHRAHGRGRRDPARPARVGRAVVLRQGRGGGRVGRHPGDPALAAANWGSRRPPTCTSPRASPT